MAMYTLLLLPLLLAAEGKDEKAELKKFEGTWQLVSEVLDGKEQSAEYVKRIRFLIDNKGHWKVEDDGKVMFTGVMTVYPDQNPKAADSTLASPDEHKGKVVRMIYELDGDAFKQCWTVERERPKVFDPKPGPGVNYSVYKRVKK
jgi:uncharacterized protein (TIGR03067 family)